MKKSIHILVAIGVIGLGYLLRDALKQKFHIPHTTASHNLAFNVTLLSTNDLHSTFSGLGLRSYPKQIRGGYSKLVTLINSIR